MGPTTPDIPWREDVAAAFAEARARGLAVALKPLGQGMGCADDW